MKHIISILFVTLLSCALSNCGTTMSKEEALLKAGQHYILDNLKSPSTAVFISHYTAQDTKQSFIDNGIEFKPYQDVMMIEVEGTNGYGGRETVTYIVFYVDGKPISMMDARNVNKFNVREIFSTLRIYGWEK